MIKNLKKLNEYKKLDLKIENGVGHSGHTFPFIGDIFSGLRPDTASDPCPIHHRNLGSLELFNSKSLSISVFLLISIILSGVYLPNQPPFFF